MSAPPWSSLDDLPPSLQLWGSYEKAFEYFNWHLFKGELPACILMMNAKGKSLGCFHPKSWDKNGQAGLHEISLNPVLLKRDDDLMLQIFVRQLVHLKQHLKGTLPPNLGYCNKDFTLLMKEIGLPCEQEFGQNVRHKVEENGLYAKVRPQAIQEFFPLRNSYQVLEKRKTRFKFTCPVCGMSVMGAGNPQLICRTTEKCDVLLEKEPEPGEIQSEQPESKPDEQG
ncbi:MAG: hypothetical protein KME46_21990 [Brasilonema angustatum HA4187-MV1]|jgi:predicted SprT family Zn-dependent metalloprotease|nr:hypothetical protein [Brasilonema angustatum HA4187-MV1]